MLESVLKSLPTGAALVLEVGDEEPFYARPIVGAPAPTERVSEHLLDGQQRLTALRRAFHDNYADRTYVIATEIDVDGERQVVVHCQPRHTKHGARTSERPRA